MRVTGGTLGGRKLAVPKEGVRPTQDRVREAVFSSLGEYVVGASVLDLFAGSGAYGLEAWSRGAERVCWVEQDRNVLKYLKRNVSDLCGETQGVLRITAQDVWNFVQRRDGYRYNLAFADPPYNHDRNYSPLHALLSHLVNSDLLSDDGVLVYEQSREEEVASYDGWALLRDRVYGSTRILIFRRINRTTEQGVET